MVHKFKSGDLVEFETGFLQPRTASGVYTVVRALPASPDGHLQYQVKSDVEPYGRLALEHQARPGVRANPAAALATTEAALKFATMEISESPDPRLSPSERLTLKHVAEGGFSSERWIGLPSSA